MNVPTISPQSLHDLVQAGREVELIDVRTPKEFQEIHASLARNEPLERLDPKRLAARGAAAPALYVICRSGGRGRQACEKLAAAGCTNVVNVEGGTLAWEQAGLPVVRGAKTMSLERQVRIAAGSLVLVGALMGYFVHPYWIALSGFVGAGLVFAGITDTCGMGLLLARMPWNRVPASAAPNQPNASSSCCTP
ncbi:MAG: rhodanese-like domain-containing protein [Pirellulales bacterium]